MEFESDPHMPTLVIISNSFDGMFGKILRIITYCRIHP